MIALSVRQPWAWLIVSGWKDVENRTRRIGYRGPLLIHASKTPDPELAFIREELAALEIHVPEDLDYGGVVGQVTVTDCVTESDSPWFEGPFAYVLDDPQPLPFRPFPGQLGLFDVPA